MRRHCTLQSQWKGWEMLPVSFKPGPEDCYTEGAEVAGCSRHVHCSGDETIRYYKIQKKRLTWSTPRGLKNWEILRKMHPIRRSPNLVTKCTRPYIWTYILTFLRYRRLWWNCAACKDEISTVICHLANISFSPVVSFLPQYALGLWRHCWRSLGWTSTITWPQTGTF